MIIDEQVVHDHDELVSLNAEELAHYGVLGQKWGVRKKYKNKYRKASGIRKAAYIGAGAVVGLNLAAIVLPMSSAVVVGASLGAGGLATRNLIDSLHKKRVSEIKRGKVKQSVV